MTKLVLQRFHDNSTSTEIKNSRHYATVHDITYKNLLLEDIANFCQSTGNLKEWVPIGNVHFVKEYAKGVGKIIPKLSNYPDQLKDYFHRNITKSTIGEVDLNIQQFIKPIETKLFNGFITTDSSEFSLEQKELIKTLDSNTPIYISDVINIREEFRCYFFDYATLINCCRYDDLDTEKYIDLEEIKNMGRKLNFSFPFCLDIGISNDKIVLVEFTDAWALGMYEGIDVADYLQMLIRRWSSFKEEK